MMRFNQNYYYYYKLLDLDYAI